MHVLKHCECFFTEIYVVEIYMLHVIEDSPLFAWVILTKFQVSQTVINFKMISESKRE
jgi:hypothetical protein